MKKIVILFTLALSFTLPIQSTNKLLGKIWLKISKHPAREMFQKPKATHQESSDEDEKKEKPRKTINCRRLFFSPYSTLLFYSPLNIKRYFDNCFKKPSFPQDDNESK
jgi:hypothetical protein